MRSMGCAIGRTCPPRRPLFAGPRSAGPVGRHRLLCVHELHVGGLLVYDSDMVWMLHRRSRSSGSSPPTHTAARWLCTCWPVAVAVIWLTMPPATGACVCMCVCVCRQVCSVDDGGAVTDAQCPLVALGMGPSTDRLLAAETATLQARWFGLDDGLPAGRLEGPAIYHTYYIIYTSYTLRLNARWPPKQPRRATL
jgi:hypothetical protein